MTNEMFEFKKDKPFLSADGIFLPLIHPFSELLQKYQGQQDCQSKKFKACFRSKIIMFRYKIAQCSKSFRLLSKKVIDLAYDILLILPGFCIN